MKYNLKNSNEADKAKFYFNRLLEREALIELKEVRKTRTNQQNRAMHKFFTIIADELNNIGATFSYEFGSEIMELPYTSELIKETLWKPIQKALFNKDSTTEITTEEINQIIDVITLKFGEMGIPITFPSRIGLLIENDYLR